MITLPLYVPLKNYKCIIFVSNIIFLLGRFTGLVLPVLFLWTF